MEEFSSSFHSLDGITIGERRKHLFLLLKNTPQGSDFDFSRLQPKTPLEEKFKVETLLYFKRTKELIEVLQNENPILRKTVLKEKSWFLLEALKNITGEQLVSSVFPHLSFNAKVKILNKLSATLNNSKRADGYFKSLEKKYGLYLASKILPACSPALILNTLKNKITITERQLLIIIKRYPDITEPILKELDKKRNIAEDYKLVSTYLAQHNITLFLKLHKEYRLSSRLGWRVTDKFIKTNKQEIIKNAEKYYNLLHKKQIPKSLKQDFNDFYFNLFPPSLMQFKQNFNRSNDPILKIVETSKNIELLLNTFERAYGSKFLDEPKFIDTEILDLLPPNLLEGTVKIENRPNHIAEEKWYTYLKTEKSIPYLKKAISLCSDIKSRADLIPRLVETCKINNDAVAFTNLCSFIVTKHRNDHISVRLAFMRSVRKCYKLECLTEQQWAYLNELIQIFVLNDEQFYHASEFLEGYINYRLINNLSINEQIEEWIKANNRELNIIKSKPEYERQCLMLFGEMLPKILQGTALETYYVSYLSALIDWNKRHKEQFSLFQYTAAIEVIKTMITTEKYTCYFDPIVIYCAQNKTYSAEKTELVHLYLTKHMDLKLMIWLIKYEPKCVVENISAVKKLLLEIYNHSTNNVFWQHSRYYDHLEIPQNIKTICLTSFREDVKKDESDTMIKNVIAALSYLMTNQEFKEFIQPYYPKTQRADNKSDDDKLQYKFQQSIGPNLKNLIPASSAMECILNFCKGDYLKLIQRSLYSLSGNINEEKLPPFFDDLAGRAVSIRKHAMHLTFRVLSKEQIYNVVTRFMEKEKNVSIRKFIFKSVFHFFIINPDDYVWELVKSNIQAVETNDKEAMDILLDVNNVPPKYIVQYILFTWDILSKLTLASTQVESYRTMLVRSLKEDVIRQLPPGFCKNIIDQYFFNIVDGSLTFFQSTIQTFACKYVIYCNTKLEQENRLKSIMDVVKQYIASNWNKSEIRTEARNCVSNFFRTFCTEFLNDDSTDTDILVKFVNLINDFLKPHQFFEDYLYLQFTLLYVEKMQLEQLAKKLIFLFVSLSKTYGAYMVEPFSELMEEFISNFTKHIEGDSTENRYILIQQLMSACNSVNCLLLVILLLGKHKTYNPTTETKYEQIIEVLMKNPDPVVQLYLNSHFKNIND